MFQMNGMHLTRLYSLRYSRCFAWGDPFLRKCLLLLNLA